MHIGDLKEIIGYILAGLVALVAWLGKREVKRLDDQHADHEARLRMMEEMARDIMKRPDVLALFSEQKEDHRQKVDHLREDHKELKQEISSRFDAQESKIDLLIRNLVNRPQNQRDGDANDSR